MMNKTTNEIIEKTVVAHEIYCDHCKRLQYREVERDGGWYPDHLSVRNSTIRFDTPYRKSEVIELSENYGIHLCDECFRKMRNEFHNMCDGFRRRWFTSKFVQSDD